MPARLHRVLINAILEVTDSAVALQGCNSQPRPDTVSASGTPAASHAMPLSSPEQVAASMERIRDQ
jgi:hypothetical protein